jgi:hypothetical protein
MLTIDVPEIDASTLKVDIQEQKITITAKSPSKDVNVELNTHGKVKAENAKYGVHGKSTEFVIYRADEGEYWPRLLSDSTKFPWLRVDWGKWVDEDEEDVVKEAADPMDMSALMSSMGGMGGMGGMPNFGGMGGMPNFGDDDEDDDDEDGEDGDDVVAAAD